MPSSVHCLPEFCPHISKHIGALVNKHGLYILFQLLSTSTASDLVLCLADLSCNETVLVSEQSMLNETMRYDLTDYLPSRNTKFMIFSIMLIFLFIRYFHVEYFQLNLDSKLCSKQMYFFTFDHIFSNISVNRPILEWGGSCSQYRWSQDGTWEY